MTLDSLRHQRGVALLVVLTLLSLIGLSLLVGRLSAGQFQLAREERAAVAMAQAREGLIGDAISRLPLGDAGYLRLPDLGSSAGAPTEGQASLTFSGDGKDLTVIGKFPWKTLDTGALRDRQGECLWYVLSGRFKNDTDALKTDVFNWDTQGQVDIITASGDILATNLVALIVAPGSALDGQSRTPGHANYIECGGNYDVRNYLDAFDNAYAIAGQINYFSGGTNNRVATNTDNKQFVMADTDHYNDRFLFVKADDIFNPLIRRRDFSGAIASLLDDPVFRNHLKTVVLAGNKGTGKLDCHCNNLGCTALPGDTFQGFCENWKEMLFLTQLPVPEKIIIDGAPSLLDCQRVLIFAGRKAAGQSRSTPDDKTNKVNYLESPNVSSFAAPTASANNFAGASAFDWRTPSTDLVRCLP